MGGVGRYLVCGAVLVKLSIILLFFLVLFVCLLFLFACVVYFEIGCVGEQENEKKRWGSLLV